MCLDGIGACGFARAWGKERSWAGNCVRPALGLQASDSERCCSEEAMLEQGRGRCLSHCRGTLGTDHPARHRPWTPATRGQEQAGQKDKRAEVRLGVSGDRLPEPCLKVTSS